MVEHSPDNGLHTISDAELAELYAQLEPEDVITPGDRRRLVVVAQEVQMDVASRKQ